MAATPEEGEDDQQWCQRTKQETGATSGKGEDIICGPWTNSGVGGYEVSS
jgi:hypothetical protein